MNEVATAAIPVAPRRRSALRDAGIGLLLTVSFLGFLEGGLRLYLRVILPPGSEPWRRADAEVVPDDELFYRLKPSANGKTYAFGKEKPFRVNARGFRGAELTSGGPVEVVGLGDSCTFGVGVDETGTWPAQLAGKRVVNAGVPGYASLQFLGRLRRDVMPLQPRVVIVYGGWNDMWDALSGKTASPTSGRQSALHSLRRNSVLVKTVLTLAMAGRTSVTDPKQVTANAAKFEPTAYRDNLRAIVRECKSEGVRVALCTMPWPGTDCAEWPKLLTETRQYKVPAVLAEVGAMGPLVEKFNRAIRQAAQEESVPVIDLASDFAARADRGALFVDLFHPNERGHGLVAATIAPRARSLVNDHSLR